MIVEQRTYNLEPGAVQAHLSRYEEQGLDVQQEILGRLLGYYVSDTGQLNQVVHMWLYEDYADRQARRTALSEDPRWVEYLRSGREHIRTQYSQILVPTRFSPDLGRHRAG